MDEIAQRSAKMMAAARATIERLAAKDREREWQEIERRNEEAELLAFPPAPGSPRWQRYLDLIDPPVKAEPVPLKQPPQPEPAPPPRQAERAFRLERTVRKLRHEIAALRQEVGGEFRPRWQGYRVKDEADDIHRTEYLPGTFRSGRGFE